MNRVTLVEQLRHVVGQLKPTVTSSAIVAAVRADSVDVRSNALGTTLPRVPVVGGVGSLAVGDELYLLHTFDGKLLAMSPKSVAGGGPISVSSVHNHDDLYYQKPEDQSYLGSKSDLGHKHVPPQYISALGGTIGGWNIGTDDISAIGVSLGRWGYLGLGPQAAVPTSYGAHLGAYIGYDPTGDQAQLSLYKDASNYLQWDGTKLLVKAANFTLDSSGSIFASNVTLSGTITATLGAIGGWVIAAHSLTGGQVVLNDSGLIRGNYAAGLRGYQLDASGNAEVNNLIARGEFRASVFTIDEQHALGGTQVIQPAAGLYAQTTTI